MDDIRIGSQSHRKIVRLYVAVQVVSLVQDLKALNKLVPEHEGGLEAKPIAAKFKKITQARSKQVYDCIFDLIFGRDSGVQQTWKSLRILKYLNRLDLCPMKRLHRRVRSLNFDCHRLLAI